jgi:methionyl-tRNA formyltransferase
MFGQQRLSTIQSKKVKAALNSLKEAAPDVAISVALTQQIGSRIADQRKYDGYCVDA